jgi:hypothetical protein
MNQNNIVTKEVPYNKDPKYSCGPNENNDRHSGSNPFYLCLPGACHLIYENNTCIGQKYVAIPRDTLPSLAAKTAYVIADKISSIKAEKKEIEINQTNSKKCEQYKKEARVLEKNKRVLLKGEQGMYYMVGGEKYDEHFPYEWATNHLSHPNFRIGSGPRECENCKKYGSILTVFVGYCMDCHKNIYKNLRPGIPDALNTPITDFREYLPYMKDVRFINIGDRKGWTLLKERAQRRIEEIQKERNNIKFEYAQLQTRNDLLIRTRRNENVSEEEWEDSWGSHTVTKEDLFRWVNSDYL